MNIEFRIPDATAARDAIEILAYIAAGFDPAFPACSVLAALPGEAASQGREGDDE